MVLAASISNSIDNINHGLLLRFIKQKVNDGGILWLIGKWLNTEVVEAGTLSYPEMGTPQGGMISPLLANLFLHYTFDMWLDWTFPNCQFERYADDAVVHCETEEAQAILRALSERMKQCKLELHPEKTKIVYREDDSRKEES